MTIARSSFHLSAREQLLDEILTTYLKAVDAGEAPDQRALLARYPELAAELVEFFANQDRFDCLAAPLRGLIPVANAWPAEPITQSRPGEDGSTVFQRGRMRNWQDPDLPGGSLGDFELLDEIGQGGMGVVYRARQKRLNRVVALKMIRPGVHATPEARARFLREAQAAARLQHTNVVQIHEIGDHVGRPYIALEYVHGCNLAQHLDGTPLPPHQAAHLVETLARPIYAAHCCSIIHRDLKPANILLGGGGSKGPGVSAEAHGTVALTPPLVARCDSSVAPELWHLTPKITDFGLAKHLDDSRAQYTETGAVVGTPSYMAPEQAEGKKEVGQAADIYALGAILYECLTGRPPFKGATPVETLRQVVCDQPVPPRRLQSGVPRDLETICLKCLDKDPHRRYATALGLAEELRRFREGRPILARPVGPVGRLWRWCRRQPLLAALLAGIALFTALVLIIILSLWLRADGHARQAEKNATKANQQLAEAVRQREEAERQRDKADRNFRLAHRAVKDFGVRVSEKELPQVPGLQPLRKELLEGTLNYYDEFVQQNGHDPALRAELADTQFRVARITKAIGSPEKALESYRKAQAVYEDLLRTDPSHVGYRAELARIHNNVGIIEEALGRPRDALASFHCSLRLWEQVVAVVKNDLGYRTDLASTHNNIGAISADTGDLRQADVSFREALKQREALAREYPNEPEFQSKVASSHDNVGVLYEKLGQPKEALAAYEEALAIRQRLVKRYPAAFQFVAELVQSHRHVGDELSRLGRHDEALRMLEEGRDRAQKLSDANRSVSHYRVELAACHTNLGFAHRAASRNDAALDAFAAAGRIFEELGRQHPGVPYYQIEVAKVHFNIGLVLASTSRGEEAATAYQNARRIQQQAVDACPDRPMYRSDLGITLNNLGGVLGQLGRHDEALVVLRLAIKEQQRALREAPQIAQCRRALASHHGATAEVLRAANRPTEAVAATLERQKLCTQPDDLFVVAREIMLAAALIGKGKDPLPAADQAERVRCADLAMMALRQAVAAGFRDLTRLENEKALAPLRDRADFASLVAKLKDTAARAND